MSKDGIVAFIEECCRRVPPKQTGFLDYFRKLLEMAADGGADQNKIAASLWLILLKPGSIESVASSTWSFRLDEVVLGILQKMVSRGMIGVGDTIDVAKRSGDGTTAIVLTFDIVEETMKTIFMNFHSHNVSPGCELKLIQLLLTASTSPNRAIGGPQLGLALEKLSEVFRVSRETVNRNAARAAITQIVNERMEGTIGGSQSCHDQIEIFRWLCKTIRSERCPVIYAVMILDLIESILETHKSLFAPGRELCDEIGNELLSTMIGTLNIKNEKIYDRLLNILEVIIRNYVLKSKETIEIVMVDYFDLNRNNNNNDGQYALPLNLLPYKNKLRTVRFIRTIVFEDPSLMIDFFANFDCNSRTSSIVQSLIKLLLVFIKHPWHSNEGTKTPGSTLTDFEVNLKLICVETLLVFIASLTNWYRKDVEQSTSLNLFLRSKTEKEALESCVESFNDKPRSGIDLAIKKGLIPIGSNRKIAEWIRFTRKINKKAAGKYLGSADNAGLLAAFASTFEFDGLSFVKALRLFLEACLLPGESQVVERFMEGFSTRLHECDPSKFADQEALFQLSYSTLMLNTDMHSSSIKVKMSKEEFKRNTRRVVSIEKIPDEIIDGIFDEIAEREIQLEAAFVEHPFPLGSRDICVWSSCQEGEYVAALITATCELWSQGVAEALNRSIQWSMDKSQFSSHLEFLSKVLVRVRDFISIACELKLEKELREALGRILASTAFLPDTSSSPSTDAIEWLFDVCNDWGSVLGSSWIPILRCVSKFELNSVARSNEEHSRRELNLSKLDGNGLLAFLTALLTIEVNSFVACYLEKLFQSPTSQVEKVIRASYEYAGVSSHESFFGLLSKAFSINQCSLIAFDFVQLIAREHIPLILSLPNEAMFDYLRTLENFGLGHEARVTSNAIEVFLVIGELLFIKNRDKIKVEDEIFFLKWYHVLSGLCRLAVEQSSIESSRLAIKTLFKLINDQGSVYQTGAWRVVWRSILFPLLEDMRSRDALVFIDLIQSSIDLLCKFEWSVEVFVFILKYLESMCTDITQDYFPERGLHNLKHLILENHLEHFDGYIWKLMIDTLQRIFTLIVPSSINDFEDKSIDGMERPKAISEICTNASTTTILFPRSAPPMEIPLTDIGIIARKCAVQILFLEFLKNLHSDHSERGESIYCKDSKIGNMEIMAITSMLGRSFEFAVEFNANLPLREAMVHAQIASDVELVVLHKQETSSLQILLDTLYHLHRTCFTGHQPACLKESNAAIMIANKYNDASLAALRRYMELKQLGAQRKSGKSWIELVQIVFRQWRAIYEVVDEFGQSVDRKLYLISERMIDSHFEVALEAISISDRSAVALAAKEYIRFSHSRLSKFRLHDLK